MLYVSFLDTALKCILANCFHKLCFEKSWNENKNDFIVNLLIQLATFHTSPKNFSTFDPWRKTFPKNDIEKLAAALYLPKNVIKGCSKDSNY